MKTKIATLLLAARHAALLTIASTGLALPAVAADCIVYQGGTGPGAGKHVVLLSGDEEYRSEESMPMLGKILAQRHGFKCTVLFALDANGVINPTNRFSLGEAAALDSADCIIMALRFREWPDEQMKHFADAYLAGKPIIALRTSTHAFKYAKNSTSAYKKYSWDNQEWKGGFGRQVLGETWVAHHGAHKKEATRGVIEPAAKDDPILQGVADIFGNTDVYVANPMSDSKILLRGQVLTGMNPTDGPVVGPKNEPMMPVAWTRLHKNEAGKVNKILCTTMGSATDLACEDLRRLLINGVYWCLDLKVPAKADAKLVDPFEPSFYGFGAFKPNVKPADLGIQSK